MNENDQGHCIVALLWYHTVVGIYGNGHSTETIRFSRESSTYRYHRCYRLQIQCGTVVQLLPNNTKSVNREKLSTLLGNVVQVVNGGFADDTVAEVHWKGFPVNYILFVSFIVPRGSISAKQVKERIYHT